MVGPRVVVIGAGVVGAALADELALRGWDDVTVVDQGTFPAFGGSSSHAPGLVFQTNPSKAMSDLARYTVEKLSGLELDGRPCFAGVGGLEVAITPDRLADLHRRCGWATSWRLDARVVGPEECVRLYPLLDPDLVLGGLYVPTDGVARAVDAVAAQLGRARERGVRVLPGHEVLDVRVSGGRVTGVVTDHGELPADVVVCCAGIWGPRVTAMVGMPLPLTPLAHQLAWTTPVPAMAELAEAAGGAEIVRPIVRHQGADLYLRDRFDRVAVGWYGHRPMPVDAAEIGRTREPMPSVLPFTPDDFADAWTLARELVPELGKAAVETAFNGLFSFTTDDFPLLGPARDVEGFWVAEAVWVTHSAGVGRAMAEWLVDGTTTVDLHECDVNRFEPHQLAPDYVLDRGRQNFVEVYDVKHPLEPMTDPRPLRTSPFHPRQRELGAVFLEAAGWERPQWYEANAPLLTGRSLPAVDPWAARWWSPIAAAEAQVTRERVALYDMTALKRLEVSGPGATAFLQDLVTGDVGKAVGSVTYCLLLREDGAVHSDVTVARLAPDRYQVGANGPLDHDRLARRLPADGSVVVRDLTPGTCCIGLWGPRARDVLAPLTTTDVSNEAFGYFRARELYVGHVPVTALRLSYVGELGWELYTTTDLGLKLWDTLWAAGREHGIIAAGRAAFNGLRLEKGYRAFGVDLTSEHDPWEAGLGFAVRTRKESFAGRDAALARRDAVRRRLTCLTLPRDAATGLDGVVLGRELTVGWFDRRLRAVVTAEPLVDPEMRRLRS